MDETKLRQLDSDGFCMLPGFMGDALLEKVRARVEELFASEGDEARGVFKPEPGAQRLGNLVGKGEMFERAIVMGPILEGISHVLGPDFKLCCLSVRVAEPNNGGLQPLHVDMGLLPDAKGFVTCNTMWMLDDFTADNGALRVVPGSHRLGRHPQEVVEDPMAPHPSEVLITGKAGDVVVINAATWHSGTVNRTSRPRRAMHAFYVRSDIPQLQNLQKRLPAETQARFGPEVRRVLALDDPISGELPDWGDVEVCEIRLTEDSIFSYIFRLKDNPI